MRSNKRAWSLTILLSVLVLSSVAAMPALPKAHASGFQYLTLHCKVMEPGAPSGYLALAGEEVSPTSALCSASGTTTLVSVDPEYPYTFTTSVAGPISRFIGNSTWSDSNTVYTYMTPASGNVSLNLYIYYQLHNHYGLLPTSPNQWDGNYVIDLFGTYTGQPALLGEFFPAHNGGIVYVPPPGVWADYNTTAVVNQPWNSTTPDYVWAATNASSWRDTTGGNYHTTAMTRIQEFQYHMSIGENQAGPPQTFNIETNVGCSVMPTHVTGNGLLVEFSSIAGCPIYILNARNATARIIFPNGSGEESFTPVANGTYAFTYDYQLNVTIVTDNPSVSSASPSGTNWVNYGRPLTIGVSVTDNSYNLPDGRFLSWSSTSGVFVTAPSQQVTTAVPTEAGVVTADVASVAYSVASPNPATVSFWVFPAILLVVFGLYLFTIAARNGASSWARNYMLLTGLVVGSIITVMTATLDVLVLLLSLIFWFFYAYRG